ncbi:hypothetical protein Hte_008368 [Hypoxylon texense]
MATIDLSPRLKAYFHKGFTIYEFHLGEFPCDLKYTVSNDSLNRDSKSLLSLHDGTAENGPLVATIYKPPTRGPISQVKITAFLPSKKTIHLYVVNVFGKVKYPFLMDVGQLIRFSEKFEWRPSHGSEVRAIHPSARGCKLVRMGHEGPGGGQGGGRKTRQSGETSDGMEVVAVWGTTHGLLPSALTLEKKPFTFHLCGSAKRGELGDEFPVIALMTALQIYVMTEQPMVHHDLTIEDITGTSYQGFPVSIILDVRLQYRGTSTWGNAKYTIGIR